jgi:D-alanine transaminase
MLRVVIPACEQHIRYRIERSWRMSSAPTVAWMNGAVVPFVDATVPLEDRGLQFGESLYEVVAITAGAPRMLFDHALRMRSAAEGIQIAGGVPAPEDWVRIVAQLQELEQMDEGLIIAQVTGGVAPRTHVPSRRPSPSFFAYFREFAFPRDLEVEAGARVITRPDIRWARSDLKTTMLLPAVMAKREALQLGASEAILVGPDGLVHEGAASNVFIVEGRVLFTPAPSHQALPGLTGPMISRLAARAALCVEAMPIPLERLRRADEVFLTSTTLLLMPVVSVDGQANGDGRSGPTARRLATELRRQWRLD